MATKVGKSCKVTIGANKVLGVGTFNLPGADSDLLDDSEFGDDWKQYKIGMKDGGEITFNGLYDPADTTGQDYLRSANLNDTQVTDIRFYVDANSYWIPKTTGPASYVLVTGWEVSAEMNGMVQCSFTCKVSGAMELL
jgi:hypothetical protein